VALTPFKNEAVWQRVRRQVLERDDGLCQIRGERCKDVATAVDHIVPWSAGGDWYDLGNLRASCAWCNSSRVWRGSSSMRRPSREW